MLCSNGISPHHCGRQIVQPVRPPKSPPPKLLLLKHTWCGRADEINDWWIFHLVWQFNYDALLPKNKITIVSKKNDKRKKEMWMQSAIQSLVSQQHKCRVCFTVRLLLVQAFAIKNRDEWMLFPSSSTQLSSLLVKGIKILNAKLINAKPVKDTEWKKICDAVCLFVPVTSMRQNLCPFIWYLYQTVHVCNNPSGSCGREQRGIRKKLIPRFCVHRQQK